MIKLASPPHVLLQCESRNRSRDASELRGHWRFVIQSADGSRRIEVHDVEPGVTGERLALLTIVRGLEALEQPSMVTLVTSSRYVRAGLTNGLEQWAADGWRWERYGQMVPVKNVDLWKRVHQTLQFHTVVCRVWRIDDELSPEAAFPGFSGRSQPPHNRLKPALDGCRSRWDTAVAF